MRNVGEVLDFSITSDLVEEPQPPVFHIYQSGPSARVASNIFKRLGLQASSMLLITQIRLGGIHSNEGSFERIVFDPFSNPSAQNHPYRLHGSHPVKSVYGIDGRAKIHMYLNVHDDRHAQKAFIR